MEVSEDLFKFIIRVIRGSYRKVYYQKPPVNGVTLNRFSYNFYKFKVTAKTKVRAKYLTKYL